MSTKSEAEKEKTRLQEVFSMLKIKESKKAREFYEFAHNYFKDGLYFFEKQKFLQAFEAFVISWSYIDAGLKLEFFSVPQEQKKWFTA
jgi:hypothetical protein